MLCGPRRGRRCIPGRLIKADIEYFGNCRVERRCQLDVGHGFSHTPARLRLIDHVEEGLLRPRRIRRPPPAEARV